MNVYFLIFQDKSCCCCLSDSVESACKKCASFSEFPIVKVECFPYIFVE